MAGDVYVATESVLTWFEGENVYITVGETARAGHPILKGREALFVPQQVTYDLPEPKAQAKTPPQAAPAPAAAPAAPAAKGTGK